MTLILCPPMSHPTCTESIWPLSPLFPTTSYQDLLFKDIVLKAQTQGIKMIHENVEISIPLQLSTMKGSVKYSSWRKVVYTDYSALHTANMGAIYLVSAH